MFDLVQIGLEVVGAKCDDAGAYECHLSNELGKETGVCNVTVHKIYKPPHFSRQLNNVRSHHMYSRILNFLLFFREKIIFSIKKIICSYIGVL